MASSKSQADIDLAIEIDDAVKRKDYAWLESQSSRIHRQWSSAWMPWNSEVSPFNTAIKNKDLSAPFVSFNNYNQLKGEDRMKIAPIFIEAQSHDPKARIHTMLLFMNALIGMNLNEVKFWHDQGDLFHQLEKLDGYALKQRPIDVVLGKDNSEVFEYLLKCEKCSDRSRTDKIRLMIEKLLQGSFGIAEVLWADANNPVNEIIPGHSNEKFSLIHYALNSFKDGVDRTGAVKWLLEKGVTDYDSEWNISEQYPPSTLNPAFVAACYIKDAATAKLLLEYEPNKWKNNAGPIIEILPVWTFNAIKGQNFTLDETQRKASNEEISKLLDLLVPLINPDTREVDLANSLAASILWENEFLEAKLRALGADLQHVTRKDEYHFGKGRTYAIRLKLLNLNGELILPIEDKDDEHIVGEITVNTRTTNIANIKKKMKNVHPESDIYFNTTVVKQNNNWDSDRVPLCADFDSPIKVWDRETGLIYKDTPFIRSLFVGDVQRRSNQYSGIPFGDPLNINTYNTRYSLFVKCTGGSWANGYQIVYKPDSGYTPGVIGPAEIEKAKLVNEDKNETERPRRSTRATKRKIEEDKNEDELEEQPKNKKRRVAKK